MQFDRKKPDIDNLLHFIIDHYEKQGRAVQYLGEGQEGDGGTEGDNYYVDFLLDKKHQIRCSLPLAIRTFSTISIGMGPYFVPLRDLVPYVNWKEYIFDADNNGLKYILKKLDEYFKTQEEEQCREFCKRCKCKNTEDHKPK